MYILLLLLLAFIIWPIIKGAYRIWQLRRQAQQLFNNLRQQQQHTPPQSKRKPKIYGPDEGEYIDFEEMPPDPTANHTHTAQPHTTYTREARITDAQWEDIDG